MAKPARKRETINSRLVYNFHPMFRDAGRRHFYYGNDSRVARAGHLRGRRHPGHRQRRRDDRDGRAHHAAGRRDPGPAAVRARRGRPGHRGRAAEDPGVHAPRHRDDDGRPRRVHASTPTCPTPALVHPDAGRHAAATTRSTENAELFPVVADALGSTSCGCCGPRSTGWAPSASSGTTATTSSPSRPGVILGYERNTTTNTLPAPTRASRSSPSSGSRARPRPRRPAVHDLPDRARRGLTSMSFEPAGNRELPQGARLHARRSGSSCSDLSARPQGGEVRRHRARRGCAGKNIALIFEKTSTRTRCAFEVAAYDQGAHVTYLDPCGVADRATRSRSRTPPGCSAGCTTGSSTAGRRRRTSRSSRRTPACRSGTGSPTSGTRPRRCATC